MNNIFFGIFKRKRMMTILAAGLLAGLSLPAADFSGRLTPLPQRIGTAWRCYPVIAGQYRIAVRDGAPANVQIGAELLRGALERVERPGSGKPWTVEAGTLAEPAIRRLLPDAADWNVRLPKHGYLIRPLDDSRLVVAGKDARGAFYGLMTLRQLVGPEGLAAADIIDYPVWADRYVADYGPARYRDYLELAGRKVSGFAFQWRLGEWCEFSPDADSGPEPLRNAFADIRRCVDEDLLDFMFLINIYAAEGGGSRKYPWFNCASEEDVTGLIDRLRFVAASGVRHIMICTDDWTPLIDGRYVCPNEDERSVFGDSVGKAHACLMNRLAEALLPEFPALELSLVPPPYSVRNHRIGDPKISRYLKDFHAVARPEIIVVWTGGEVCSRRISKADFDEYQQYIPGRRLILWDNSDCFEDFMPGFASTFYPGFDTDSHGTLYVNAFTFGAPWHMPFVCTVNDYAWNPVQYDLKRSYRAATLQLYGEERSRIIWDFRSKVLELLEAQAADDEAAQRKLLPEAEALLAEFPRYDLSTHRLPETLERVKELLDAEVPQIPVPIIETEIGELADIPPEFWQRCAVFALQDNRGGDGDAMLGSTVRMGFAGRSLLIQLDLAQPAMADLAEPRNLRQHDDGIYSNPELIELFVQPGAGGYGHLAFDCFGYSAEEKNMEGNDGWNPDWRLMVERRENSWTAVIRIPLAELEKLAPVRPQPGVVWRFNILRQPYRGATQGFSPTRSHSFHTPALFGIARFQ